MDPAPDRPTLTPVEQRVLGSLLEKERTVPDSYPMSLNGVRTACNQASGRDPVLSLVESEVAGALDDLKGRGLVRMVHASHGARVVKFRQVLDEHLELTGAERAVLTLLLLRGAQTPGELRSRSERLHAFGDRSGVEGALAGLRDRHHALVAELDRRPGQKERRWTHLLGPVDAPVDRPADAGPPSERSTRVGGDGPDRSVTEAVLVDGPGARDRAVVRAYDEVATTYADHLVDELDGKPFDRWLLERVVTLAEGGPVADVGCGPGQVAFHLAAAGGDVTGFDLSPAMVAEARRRFGELTFAVADLGSLPPPADAEGWAAVVAWYALVHLAGSELGPAFGRLAGALRPGGWLAVAVHVGPEVRRLAEWWGHEVDLAFTLHDPDQVLEAAAAAGLVDLEWYRRGPYAGAETETERLYVLGRRPS